jgi:tRNA A37 threonylcarbamoyltransferase TsaD
VHEKYGGVVPELASRAHQQNIIPTVDTALKEAGISKNQLSAIAFTRGPGLLGSLIVGTGFAKVLPWALIFRWLKSITCKVIFWPILLKIKRSTIPNFHSSA